MNNTFNINRFYLLLKRQWLEFGKIYLICLAIIAGIITAFYGYNYFVDASRSNLSSRTFIFREPLFIIIGILFLTIVANNYFAQLGQKSKAIIELLVPASKLEKLLAGVLFTSILSLGCYLFIFYVIDLIFIGQLNAETKMLNYVGPSNLFFGQYFTAEHKFVPAIVGTTALLISSLFFLGSIYFNRFHYVKTLVCILVFTAIYAFIITKSASVIFAEKVSVMSGPPVSKNQGIWLLIAIVAVITVVFYAISYVRLKEKEV